MTEIRAAEPSEWIAALHLQYAPVENAQVTQVANCLGLLASGEVDPGGILVAKREEEIVGVQLAVPLPGSSGLIWPPRVNSGEDLDLEDRLVEAGLDFLRSRRARVVHAILPHPLEGAALLRAGLAPMTYLCNLLHELRVLPEPRPMDWQLHSFDPNAPLLFQDTLLRTYEDTLDCPELNGLRCIDEIMTGHKAQGQFRPELWQLALMNGEPVAILIVNPLREAPVWDLSYLGVVPHMRGRGLGEALTVWALHRAHAEGATELQVAVDERNEPALRLYHKLGFVELNRRLVLWRPLVSWRDDFRANHE